MAQKQQKNDHVKLIIVISSVIILITALYLLSKSRSKELSIINPSVNPTQIVQISPISTDAYETVNWKTYRSKNQYYEFRYPPSFYLREYAADVVSLSNYNMKGDFRIPLENGGIFMATIEDYSFNDTSVENYLNKWKMNYDQTGAQPIPPTIISSVIIDNTSFIKTLNPLPAYGKAITYYATRNGKLYNITFMFKTEMPDPKLESTFDQVLSTFKFIQ